MKSNLSHEIPWFPFEIQRIRHKTTLFRPFSPVPCHVHPLKPPRVPLAAAPAPLGAAAAPAPAAQGRRHGDGGWWSPAAAPALGPAENKECDDVNVYIYAIYTIHVIMHIWLYIFDYICMCVCYDIYFFKVLFSLVLRDGYIEEYVIHFLDWS